MSNDDSVRLLAELEALRAQADALAARVSATVDPRSRYAGEDQNDLARVVVDSEGRATDVVISRDWRLRVGPADLAAALVAAMGEAQTRRMEGWATGGELTMTPTPMDALSGASGPDLIRELLHMLAQAERQLDEATEHIEKHFAETVEVTSPAGELTITTRGGQVAEIAFDRRWIASAGPDEVAHRVCFVLQQAHDRAWTGIGDLLPRELGHLMSFAADPERMLRQLGFHT